MVAKFTTLTQKIAIQLHLVAESCTICSSGSRRPVLKLLDTPSYIWWKFVQQSCHGWECVHRFGLQIWREQTNWD